MINSSNFIIVNKSLTLLDGEHSIYVHPVQRGTILPNEIYDKVLTILFPCIWIVTTVSGFWTNCIVVRTFIRMGLNDSITISFFVLALSDIGTSLGAAGHLVCCIFGYLELNFIFFCSVQAVALVAITGAITTMFIGISNFVTTFVSVLRALCIIRPFHFRDKLTKTKCCIVLVFFSILSASHLAAYISFYRFQLMRIDPFSNRTKYMAFVGKNFSHFQTYVEIFMQLGLFLVFQVLVIGSLIIMIYGLRESVRFRQSSGSGGNSSTKESLDKKGISEEKKDAKEKKAILQVALVAGLFVALNLPRTVLAFVYRFVDELKVFGRYQNLWAILESLRLTCEYANTCVNLPIYYNHNSKFQRLCFVPPKKKQQAR